MVMRALSVLAILLSLVASSAAADPAPPPNLADLDRQVAAMFRDAHVPGASVAIIENGRITLAKGYGLADVARRIPATGDTPFRAGSISKSITSIAIMTLVERHKLALDTPIATLLPDVHFTNPWERTHPVRLVHLLEHTTAWPDISPRILAQDGPGWSTLRGVQFTMSEFASRWRPGTFTVYNNAGPAVAGLAIERVTGKTFDAYVRDAVLRPLGMKTADFDLTPDLSKRIAKSYAADGSETPYQYIILKPAGSLNVSARELAELVRFYLFDGFADGPRILSPESVRRIERGETNLGAKYGFFNSYGLGNAAFPGAGMTFRGHNGSIDSFTSVFGYNRQNNCGYVLMANGGDGVDFDTPMTRMIQAYLTRDVRMNPPPTIQVSQAELDSYAGFYRTITPPNVLLRPYVEIAGITRVSAAPGRLVVSGSDWFPVGPHSFRRADREDASLAFFSDGGDVYKLGPFNAQMREAAWHVYTLWLVIGAIALGVVAGLAMLLFWIVLRFRKRLMLGGLLLRELPLLASVALAVNLALPVRAYTSSGTSAVHQLADIGLYSLAILATNLLFPALAAIALFRAIQMRQVPGYVRTYVTVSSLGLLSIAVYFAVIGWFPLRTWAI
jgi:CubicO group peptidase (beta-lactamase class C family)